MPEPTLPPVLVFGLDAADPDLLERWTAEGRLPALASVMGRGCWARTGGPELLFEHGTWVSIFSGVPRARHGFHFFRQLRRGTYALDLARGADAGAPPFWAALAGTGRRVLVLDAPDTPPVPGLAGVQVAEWATHSHYPPLPLRAEPRAALADVRRRFGPRQKVGEVIPGTAADARAMLGRLVARAARKADLVAGLLAERVDLAVVVFAETHTGGHQLWPFRRDARGDGPDAGQPEAAGLGDGLLRLYQAADAALATTLAALPPETNVLVVSSVGLEDMYPTEGLTEALCRTLGYQAAPAAEGPAAPPGLVDRLRRALPDGLRDALSGLLPLDVQARLLSQKFEGATDWSRTTAFALPGYYAGAVRVNLRGREPRGTVEPADYDAVLDRLDADFHALTDPATGRPAVARTVRVRDELGRDAHPALPDLHVLWAPHARPLTHVDHPAGPISQPRHAFDRGSDHSTAGFVAAAGPDVRARGPLGEVSPLAVAPTALALLGAPVPDWMAAPLPITP